MIILTYLMEQSKAHSQSQNLKSSLIESFSLGNALLKNQKAGEPLSMAVKNEFHRIRAKKESSLSKKVHQLICEPFKNVAVMTNGQEYSFIKAGYLQWDKVREKVGEDIIGTCPEINFDEAVRRIHPICYAIHEELHNCLDYKEFEAQYNLSLNGCDTRLSECFKLLKSTATADQNLCLLLVTSSLEHALGNIYLSFSSLSQCPLLLKDLLATQEIKEVFGDIAVCLLHILIGPPSSLNLRNILWHGFASPGEVPTQYTSLLLVMIASLCSKFKDSPLHSREVERRPLLTLYQVMDLNGIFPILDQSHLPEIHDLFQSSFFIISSMLPLWVRALHYFKAERFDWCVILLLPQLEHGLRRVFACVNNCPSRVLTAESTVLYTTFDEILAPTLQDGSENRLREEIGDSYLEILLDLLVFPEGPRVRDHISHGEVDLSMVSKELANHILCVCIALAGMYTLSYQTYSFVPSVVDRICQAAAQYKSVFHPVSLLAKTTRNLCLSLLKWNDLPQPFGEGFSCLAGLNVSHCIHFPEAEKAFEALKALDSSVETRRTCGWLLHLCLYPVNDFVQHVLQVLDAPFPTLFRPKGEIEIVQLLKSIAQHGMVISEQICNVGLLRHKQWESRQLRQRQRSNYKRLWSHLPFLLTALQLVIAVVLRELSHLAHDANQRNRTSLIKFLRKCLQCSENMETLSSLTKNKWDECYIMGKTLVNCIEQHYASQFNRGLLDGNHELHDNIQPNVQ